jgi:hypothetical protein
MTNYKCNICNYTTNKSSNYTKHLKTNKHLNNINNTYNNNIYKVSPDNSPLLPITPDNSPLLPKVVNNDNSPDYLCDYCKTNFKSSKHIIRHQIKSCLHIPDKIKNRLIIKHNSNPKTKNKIPLVETVQNANKIINNNNLGTINNINITLNPMGEETIDHIPDEELNEILKADHNMMYQLKNAMALVPANNNVYLNLRTKMLFYIDKHGEIRVTKISQYNAEFCYMWMNKINKLIQDNPERFGDINIKRFEDTYDIYSCRITQDNFDEIEHIEKSHHELINKFFEDLVMVNLNNNIKAKSLLSQHSPDFNKLT